MGVFSLYLEHSRTVIRGVVKQSVTASNSSLTILIIIKYNKMFVDKYAIYTLSLVISVTSTRVIYNRCYGNAPITVRDTLK